MVAARATRPGRNILDPGENSMALFVVQHTHTAATCPAPHREQAGMLLQLLASAPQQGVTILSEAVVDGQHELHILAEAADAALVRQFMAPFARMGTVTVRPASPCERVAERGAC